MGFGISFHGSASSCARLASSAAAWGAREGTLAVQMGTVTPNFETFLVNVDSKGWKPAGGEFGWELSPGRNRLEMRTRNVSGVEGPVSWLEVEKK